MEQFQSKSINLKAEEKKSSGCTHTHAIAPKRRLRYASEIMEKKTKMKAPLPQYQIPSECQHSIHPWPTSPIAHQKLHQPM
jgi:hypothetical protein